MGCHSSKLYEEQINAHKKIIEQMKQEKAAANAKAQLEADDAKKKAEKAAAEAAAEKQKADDAKAKAEKAATEAAAAKKMADEANARKEKAVKEADDVKRLHSELQRQKSDERRTLETKIQKTEQQTEKEKQAAAAAAQQANDLKKRLEQESANRQNIEVQKGDLLNQLAVQEEKLEELQREGGAAKDKINELIEDVKAKKKGDRNAQD